MLEIRSILLLLSADADCAFPLRLAAALAREHGAFVEAACAFDEPELELSDCYAIGPDAAVEVLGRRTQVVRATTAPVETAFRKALAGSAIEWGLIEPDEAAQATALRARCVDLVILPSPALHDRQAAGRVETVIQAGGAPCLIAPRLLEPRPFERVVIAWNGSRESRRAVEAAMVFLKAAATVRIVTAGAPGEADTHQLHAWLRHHGVEAEVEENARPPGSRAHFILDRCAAASADLLVMGAFGHARAVEDTFGGTTRTVLLAGVLPVLMAH